MADPVRVLIVDDSAFMRRAVQRMLEPLSTFEVVGTGSNGREALELARELRPDVIIMDVNMPEMDGLEALRRIMQEAPTSVVMMSTHTRQGAQTTLQALELGAVDFVDKASVGTAMDIHHIAPVLRDKILAAAGAMVAPASEAPPRPGPAVEREPPEAAPDCAYDLVVIGASTGGPRALVEVVSRLPAGFGAGIVIAQHMPAGFTATLAERLNRYSELRVAEAADGDPVLPSSALVAPGGMQITLQRVNGALVTRVVPGGADQLHRPSVNHLFCSAAEVVGRRAIGVMLTGMGDDGAVGLRAVRAAGGRTLVESRETAVIYGMPRSAADAAEQVLPLPRIAGALRTLCGRAAVGPEGRS
jgi:two-component system chemotaxis response regulator CheB